MSDVVIVILALPTTMELCTMQFSRFISPKAETITKDSDIKEMSNAMIHAFKLPLSAIKALYFTRNY